MPLGAGKREVGFNPLGASAPGSWGEGSGF